MVNTFFVSSPKHKAGLRTLNRQHMMAQLREANQILNIILSESKGYANHPAVNMWRGYTEALKVYINWCIEEWTSRLDRNEEYYTTKYTVFKVDEKNVEWPWWCTWKDFHLAHKCSLLRKKEEHYSKHFVLKKSEKEWLDYGYIWPCKISKSIVKKVNAGERFSPSKVCDPIGAGAPAEYRWSINDVTKWRCNPNVNPITGRSISSTSKTGKYADLQKAYKYYHSKGLIKELDSESSSSDS